MINNKLDIKNLEGEFKKKKRVLISDFLDEKFAESIYQGFLDLNKRNLWFQANFGNPKGFAKDLNDNFSYKYEKYPLTNIDASDILKTDSRRKDFNNDLNTELPEQHQLKQLSGFLNSSEVFNFMENLTSFKLHQDKLISVATKYTGGDYHATHSDDGRLAFNLFMTRNWLINWGGNLVILDESCSKVLENYTPYYNQLLLFEAPLPHAVLPVSMYSQEERYTITGWYNKITSSDKI